MHIYVNLLLTNQAEEIHIRERQVMGLSLQVVEDQSVQYYHLKTLDHSNRKQKGNKESLIFSTLLKIIKYCITSFKYNLDW